MRIVRYSTYIRVMNLKFRICVLVAVALTVISAIRVLGTYSTFSQAWDEPYHIVSGMEWWQSGSYHISEQPPLSHIFNAALPYWSGMRAQCFEEPFSCGNRFLAAGQYTRTLGL